MQSYVPNMIGGAAQADVGILIISARKGEFETGFERGGQTREHALLAKTLGECDGLATLLFDAVGTDILLATGTV